MTSPLSARASMLQVLLEGPAYGAELMARFQERTAGRARLSPARVYPMLRRLRSAGLVRATRLTPKGRRGARLRVYHQLTTRGRAAALAERALLLGLLVPPRPEGVALAERVRMAERVREGEALSEAGAELLGAKT